ncbi:hypothetical protein [Marinobacter salicampi]|uniref:hypothetical protein n=1 Tax=Marinobacter salicampi TaxID=435907 RepID=UPI0014087BD8|nr:hypothetical protein [Marinobacter salicampi]
MSEKNQELIMLYDFTGSRIAEFKAQQWAITNYGAVIYASIVSSKKLIGDISTIEIAFLNLLAFIVMVIGIWLIKGFSESIKERQKCLAEIRKKFGEEFIFVWSGGSSKVPNDGSKPKTVLRYFHKFILMFGFIITTLLLWRI